MAPWLRVFSAVPEDPRPNPKAHTAKLTSAWNSASRSLVFSSDLRWSQHASGTHSHSHSQAERYARAHTHEMNRFKRKQKQNTT